MPSPYALNRQQQLTVIEIQTLPVIKPLHPVNSRLSLVRDPGQLTDIRMRSTGQGIRFHQSAHDKVKLIDYTPADPASAVKFSEGDFEQLGPFIKENGLALSGRGWGLMYKARALAIGKPKEQLLQLAVDSLTDNVARSPNDWVANYDCACALYDLAWASPPSRRYDIMRKAYRRFRHSHKVSLSPPLSRARSLSNSV